MNTEIAASKLLKTELGIFFSWHKEPHCWFFLNYSLGLADLKICLNMGYRVTKTCLEFSQTEGNIDWSLDT